MVKPVVHITPHDLSLEDYIQVALNQATIQLSPESVDRIQQCRIRLETFIREGKPLYGINTGFGALKDRSIPLEDLAKLQLNLIRSHAVGQGEPSPDFVVRGMMLHRIKSLSIGYSGVTLELVQKAVEALNLDLIPEIPVLGTVGASGDLAPLSHLVLGLLGEGKAKDPETGLFVSTREVMNKLGMTPLTELHSKEGLALNNGTQFCTAWTIYAWHNASQLFEQSHMIAAMTVEALHGTHVAFHPMIHQLKPHPGQVHVGERMRHWLQSEQSAIYQTHGKTVVQDAYSLRCIPQIMGPVYDNLQFVRKILETEVNSVNDNPLVLEEGIVSGGNFHAMPIGNAADLLGYSMTLVANLSERRCDRLVSGSAKFLPMFLAKDPGLDSGFMIVQYASAGITAELRTMASPGSVHSIPTCANVEDLVSMAGYSARKAWRATVLVQHVLANEFFAATQAMGFTEEQPGPRLQEVLMDFRQLVPFVDGDCEMRPLVLETELFLRGNPI